MAKGDRLWDAEEILASLGIRGTCLGACYGPGRWSKGVGKGSGILEVHTPIDGSVIGRVRTATAKDVDMVVRAADSAFLEWRKVPAPGRGEFVRVLGQRLREKKEPLGKLVTLEMGKIAQEGLGEVQEMIDICDFAVGLSRQLYGLTMHSERPDHRMYEQWHPLGPIAVVSAFNFPVAVWSWNAAIALVCGDPVVWKPSSLTPLTAIAVQNICNDVIREKGAPEGLCGLVVGSGSVVGEALIGDPRIKLVSATGSTSMGTRVADVAAKRFCRTILELGGNNALLVTEDADMDLALRAVLFGAVGTAGQRCTTTRRLLVQKSISEEFVARLVEAYGQVRIGDPFDPATIMGPLVEEGAVKTMQVALQRAGTEGAKVLHGGKPLPEKGATYVQPAIVKARPGMAIIKEETFAPILYVLEFKDVDEAIRIQNDVPQGLSSSMFTRNLQSAEKFLSHAGSDCGIANINVGTSGAEIGGAFGGVMETGGVREAGSDSWKASMRRQTNTMNWSTEMPLAQGIRFDVGIKSGPAKARAFPATSSQGAARAQAQSQARRSERDGCGPRPEGKADGKRKKRGK